MLQYFGEILAQGREHWPRRSFLLRIFKNNYSKLKNAANLKEIKADSLKERADMLEEKAENLEKQADALRDSSRKL
jgi:3-dehydroquinate dehydratase